MFPRTLALSIIWLLAATGASHAEERINSFLSNIDVASYGTVVVQANSRNFTRTSAREEGVAVTFGPARFFLPNGWVRREGTPDDNPHYDAPGPNPGLGPTVALVLEDTRPDVPDAEEGTVITGWERRSIAGHMALVQHWLWDEDDTQGVTLYFRNIEPGKTLKVYGWIGRADWKARSPELWDVLSSITFADAAGSTGPAQQSEAVPPPGQAGKAWQLGAISMSAPETWQPFLPPQPLSFDGGDWELMLTEDANAVEKGGFLLLTWVQQPVLHSAELPPDSIVSTRSVTLAGLPATRTDFRLGDDTQGFDVITEAPVEGRYFLLSCRMPASQWAEAGQNCEDVLVSVSMANEQAQAPAATPDAGQQSEVSPQPSAEAEGEAEGSPQEVTQESVSAETLFSGSLEPLWAPYASAGGNFEQFAKLSGGALRVDVPAGSSWGKTGIQSREPVIEPWGPDDASEVRLTLYFDPSCTSSFVATLAARNDSDEWNASGIRVAWSRSLDGKQGGIAAWSGGYVAMEGKRDPEAPESIVVTIRGDGLVNMTMPDGQHIDFLSPYDLHKVPLYLYVLAHAPGEGNPAAMCLRSISKERVTPPEQPNSGSGTVRLLDGHMGRMFVANSSQGGRFGDHARLTPDGLVVDVPKQSGWGKVGIVAREPILWLDHWAGDARAKLTYRFDPAKTTGFFIVLAARAKYDPGAATDPDTPALQLHWREMVNGKGARLDAAWAGSNTAIFDVEVPGGSPDEVNVFLRPQGIIIAVGDTYVSDLIPWPDLSEGQPLWTWVLSLPDAVDMPVRMALRSIDLEWTPAGGASPASVVSATAAQSLPVRTLFDGTQASGWEPTGVVGGDFGKFANWSVGQLDVSVPEGNSWGRTGILSAQPLVSLDQRFFSTGLEFTLAVDKAATTGFGVAIGGEKQADMWPTYRLWASFIRRDDGNYDLVLDWGGMKTSLRNVSAETVARQWDGTMHIVINPGSSELRLGGIAETIRAPDHFNPGDSLYMTVQSNPAVENGPSQLSLRSISAQWLLPEGASEIDRMSYLEDQDFDPVKFLRLTQDEITGKLRVLNGILNEEAP